MELSLNHPLIMALQVIRTKQRLFENHNQIEIFLIQFLFQGLGIFEEA